MTSYWQITVIYYDKYWQLGCSYEVVLKTDKQDWALSIKYFFFFGFFLAFLVKHAVCNESNGKICMKDIAYGVCNQICKQRFGPTHYGHCIKLLVAPQFDLCLLTDIWI